MLFDCFSLDRIEPLAFFTRIAAKSEKAMFFRFVSILKVKQTTSLRLREQRAPAVHT